jgi:hypothetical protein
VEVDDVADALAERIGRQGYLLQRDRQFVFVIEETGDFVFRGKTITDPALITELNQHIGKADDESDVWLPARMAPLLRDALDGYEQGRQGSGQHTFAELLAATQASVIRFEMRDSYDQTEQGSPNGRRPATSAPTTGATTSMSSAPRPRAE